MKDQKFLVLDVDETLLNIEPLFFLERFKKNYQDYEGKLIFDKYYLSPRPNLKEFIKKVRNNFQLIAFSVADREATIEKLKSIGIFNDFIKIYGKEDLKDKKKSLKMISNDLNVDIDNIFGIDDIPESFLEKEKIIKIKPWFIGDSKKDMALLTAAKELEFNSIKTSS